MSAQQERMAAMFASIDDESRRYVLMVLQGEYDRAQASRRPTLRLIQGGPSAASHPTVRTSVRIKNEEA